MSFDVRPRSQGEHLSTEVLAARLGPWAGGSECQPLQEQQGERDSAINTR
jgi:hypothetical protein